MSNFGDIYTQLKAKNNISDWGLELEFKINEDWYIECVKEDTKDNSNQFKSECFEILKFIEENLVKYYVADWHLNHNLCTFKIKEK